MWRSKCLVVIVASIFFVLSASAQMSPSSLIADRDIDAPFETNLKALASKSGGAADFFRFKLAERDLKSGNQKSAMKLLGKVDSKALVFWKNVLESEIALSQGNYQKVLDTLKNLPPRPRPDLSFGETFYAGLYKRALLALREAKSSLGLGTDGESAELAANFPLDPDVNNHHADLSVEQKIVKLHALAFAYKYGLISGIITPEEIISSNVEHSRKCEALYDLGYSLRRSDGGASQSFEAFEELRKQKCGPNLEAKALYWIGFLGPSLDMRNAADRALLKLAHEHKGHRLQDDAFYLLMKHAEKSGDVAESQKYKHELLKLSRGDMRDKFVFETAFPYYMNRNYARAVEVMRPVIDGSAADETFTQLLYWYARSLQNLSEAKEAAKIYERIVSDYPFSFYAIMAAERADIPLSIPKLPLLAGKAPLHDDGFFAIIDDLNRGGYHDAGSQMMDLAVNLNPSWETSNRDFIARKYIESQNYRKALDMAAVYFDSSAYGPVEAKADPMFAAFFPRAYEEAVARGYTLTGLPPGAIEGIMREESLFQPNVRSHAGAVGLMQLMPKTAALVARKNAGGANAWDLTNPLNNILLGSSYLAEMRDKFGQMPYAIMAYNAGPGNVNRFLRSLGRMELDEFIENIPISETRGYVKRVMRSMQVYSSIYNESAPGVALSRKPFR